MLKLFIFYIFLLYYSCFAIDLRPHGENDLKDEDNIYTQIKVEDLDKDGKKEIIVATSTGKIHILDKDLNEIKTGLWPKRLNSGIYKDIIFKDIDKDEKKEILLVTNFKTMYAISFDGETKHKTALSSFPTSDIVVGDADNDDELDILVATTDGNIFMYNNEFKPKKLIISGPVLSNPVIKDTDDDGRNELIIKDATGKVHMTDNLEFGVNTEKPGFPIVKDKPFFSSSFNVADTTNNQNDELINDLGNGIVEIYDNKGIVKSRININVNNDPDEISFLYHKPLVVDVDKDGENNVVFISNDGKLFVCDKDLKPLEGYPKKVAKYCFEAPHLIDIDNDGELDIVFSGWSEGEVFNPIEKSGFITALNLKGEEKEGYPVYIGKSTSPLTIADLDNDGKLEIVTGTGIGYSGKKLVVINTKARIPISIVEIGAKYIFSKEEL